ncbi:hypothetical protein LINGRAHAP2_LOCUS4937, partial [Linum grandiflorum]
EIKSIPEKNSTNRKVQKIYHTFGSKKFLAKSKELEKEWGRKPPRGELYRETHKGKKDSNSPTRDAVMEVEEYMKDLETETDIGPNDAVGRLFKGQQHSRRVRELGFGPVPSQVFGNSSSQSSSSTSKCQDTMPIVDFQRFSDGVMSLLVRLVEANPNVPADLARDVSRFTQELAHPSSQHSHQSGERVASDIPTTSPVDITGVNSDGVARTASGSKSGTSHSSSRDQTRSNAAKRFLQCYGCLYH